MKQWVIGEENQSVSQPLFGYIWIRQKCVVHPFDHFDVARRKDRSITSGTEKPPYKARIRTGVSALSPLIASSAAICVAHRPLRASRRLKI